MKNGILLCSAGGQIRQVNDALCAMTGLGRGELVGMAPPYPFWAQDQDEGTGDSWRRIVEARGELGATLVRKDGTCLPVTVAAAELAAEDGSAMYAVTVSDCGERAALERRLRLSEERLILAAEAAAGVVFDWDLIADKIERSPGIVELLGFRPEEAHPTHEWWVSRIHPQDLPSFSETVRRAREDRAGRLYHVEYRVRHKDGSYRWIESRAVALRDGEGRSHRLVGYHADITERRKAEGALQAVFEQTTAGIAQLDPHGRFLYANRWFCDFVGYTREELLNLRMQDITHPDDLRQNLDVLEQARSSGGSYQLEKRYIRKDGSLVWANVSANVVGDAEGGAQTILGVIIDVTERKCAEARAQAALGELERASRAKDEFLAVLSHELRTPLTPVLAAVQMMERDPKLTPEQQESVVMVRRNVELEARLIDDLLDLTRISRGKLELYCAPTDVHGKVAHVVGICDPDLRSKQLTLRLELKARRHHVSADAARLQQVFWNLLKNAIKFTPEGGEITVRTEDAGLERIRVDVRDTGCGIAADALPGIFDAFVQGRDVTRRHGGLGLGLSISRKIVEMHGGTLEAFSEGEGRGSTFTVLLPITTAAVVQEPRPAQPGAETAPGRSILLVEDHPDTSRTMKSLLDHSGYRVRTADSVAAALNAADAEAFDLLICDIGLPDGSGLDLMRQLLAKHPVKGIALSGYGMEDDIRRSREAGFIDHLTKPVDVRRLEEVIRHNLS